MPGLRDILDAATPPDHGEDTWEQKQAWDRSNEASARLWGLAPELAAELLDLRERHREAMALVLDMGELLRKPVDEIEEGDAADVLARLDRLGAGDSNQNEKEQT